jgi:hypothetical protein
MIDPSVKKEDQSFKARHKTMEEMVFVSLKTSKEIYVNMINLNTEDMTYSVNLKNVTSKGLKVTSNDLNNMNVAAISLENTNSL